MQVMDYFHAKPESSHYVNPYTGSMYDRLAVPEYYRDLGHPLPGTPIMSAGVAPGMHTFHLMAAAQPAPPPSAHPEPKSTTHIPLDLSLKTIRQTPDST